MRVGIRSRLATRKICMALLLGVMPIALVIPGSDVVFSRAGTGTTAQTPLFTAIDLHPSMFISSEALGVSGGQEAGDGTANGRWGNQHALLWHGGAASVVDLISSRGVKATATCRGQQVGYGDGFGYDRHALLWRGSAASVVDLHPRGFTDSEALGTSGREQVGYGIPARGKFHALLWRGSAASVVDLHPRGFTESQATSTAGGQQVGYGAGPGTRGSAHALLWRDSASSVVDLHPRGYADSQATGISGGQQVGWGGIVAADIPTHTTFHALLWRGSAASVVDLNPRGVLASRVNDTNGKEQVGVGNGRALLWRGSAESVVDLQAFLPPSFTESGAQAIDAAGDVVGWATTYHQGPSHAILWKRNVPETSTSQGQNGTGC